MNLLSCLKGNHSLRFFFLLALGLSPVTACGEYRVFQYYVYSTSYGLQENSFKTVLSSLDPVSFIAYHGGYQSMKVRILRTWMCPGETSGFKKFCLSPYEVKLQEIEKED